MTVTEHPSFKRPTVATPLWRYVDLAKLVSFLTTRAVWLGNAEILAGEDPHEGSLSTTQFAHRQWKHVDDVPADAMQRIIARCGDEKDRTPRTALNRYMMEQEQLAIFTQCWRRDYYVSCWHASQHESVAMWKIYGAQTHGVALVSNGARIDAALSASTHEMHLGAVRYFDERAEQVDRSNGFNSILSKRLSFAYEQEVRLVHWDTSQVHDPLDWDSWNESTMRFDRIVEDKRPIISGISAACEVDVLIDKVVISPFAPRWYEQVVEDLRDKLGFRFPVQRSNILVGPTKFDGS